MSELSRPPQEPAAGRLVARVNDRSPLAAILRDLARMDLAIYRSIAATPTPALDEPLRWLSEAATRSKLWLGMAGIMAGVGGRTGRRAALTGVAAIGVDSAIVNLVGKLSFRRVRPDPSAAGVPESRRVVMPMSSSFPSGHAASGFAFAEGVAVVSPALAGPVRALAAAVAYSRVHGGVHYPGDVVVGVLIGSSVGEGVGIVARRIAAGR